MFGAAQRLSERAASRPATCSFRVAGRSLSLSGRPVLLTLLARALRHLEAPASGSGCSVALLDGSDGPLPLPDWATAELSGERPLRIAREGARSAFVEPRRGLVSLFDAERKAAWFWCPDAASLPSAERGSPLRPILTAWLRSEGLVPVHAGAVGDDSGAILVGGPSGSGKSTTCLMAVAAGMRSAGEDMVAVEPGALPVAHSLYSTARLSEAALAWLPPFGLPSELADDGKRVLFLAEARPGTMAQQLPITTLAVPEVGAFQRVRVERLRPAMALRALAPSSLLQARGGGAAELRNLARLVESVPAFRMELTPRVSEVQEALRRLLSEALLAH